MEGKEGKEDSKVGGELPRVSNMLGNVLIPLTT